MTLTDVRLGEEAARRGGTCRRQHDSFIQKPETATATHGASASRGLWLRGLRELSGVLGSLQGLCVFT